MNINYYKYTVIKQIVCVLTSHVQNPYLVWTIMVSLHVVGIHRSYESDI